MLPEEYDFFALKSAMGRSGLRDLRFACDFADRIVAAVLKAKDEEILEEGFQTFRARNHYIEDQESQPGYVHIHPLCGKDMTAPPKEKTSFGRFNAAQDPVLYLSTTREVALAEVRALPSDIGTVAMFRSTRSIRVAKLLRLDSYHLGWLTQEPAKDDLDQWLLGEAARFVARRVSDHDRELHYRTCNLIASAFRESGFDALTYRSSFWSEGWRDQKRQSNDDYLLASNIVLFDTEAATAKKSELYQIDWKRPEAEPVSGDSMWKSET